MEESISKYRNAVSTVKLAILQSRYRAAKLVTGELMLTPSKRAGLSKSGHCLLANRQ